jgi:hypothetical protein
MAWAAMSLSPGQIGIHNEGLSESGLRAVFRPVLLIPEPPGPFGAGESV